MPLEHVQRTPCEPKTDERKDASRLSPNSGRLARHDSRADLHLGSLTNAISCFFLFLLQFCFSFFLVQNI